MKTTIAAALIGLFLCTSAYSQTELEAAYHALSTASERTHSDGKEWGGVIYKCNNDYQYTLPQSNSRYDTIEIVVRYPRQCQLVALYHSHPKYTGVGSWISKLFSVADSRAAKRLGLRSYLVDTTTEKYYLYDPMANNSKLISITGDLGDENNRGYLGTALN